MPQVPILNLELAEVKDFILTKLEDEKAQRKMVLVIVSIALLLDNMLYMVIVPIIPDYLRKIGAWETHLEGGQLVTVAPKVVTFTNQTGNYTYTEAAPPPKLINGVTVYEGEESAIGLLFASKALIQLLINPFSGALIDRIGYDKPMMIGLTIMFFSTAVFSIGSSYSLLFFARSLQGVGSAFADTSGLAMIADRYTEERERTKALGIALAFISFGCLVAPPFGGIMYEIAGKEVPFLILSVVCLADGIMLWLVMKPIKKQQKEQGVQKPDGTPIWVLLMDPYIAVCAGALVMANVSLAFLEPTISVWMMDTMPSVTQWQQGMIWLPAFFPHVLGVIVTVKLSKDYPQYQYLMAAGGLALEGLCCLMIPFAKNYWVLMVPISGICFGIALIDTALLPTLGYLVDLRYVSVYGSIYAIADISYSFAYAFGPIIAGKVMESIGFTALNIGIAVSNLAYVPVLFFLRHVYDKAFQDEANVIMKDPPDKQYQTYAMQNRNAGAGHDYSKTYGRLDDDDDDFGGGGHRVTFQETSLNSTNGPSNINPYSWGDEGTAGMDPPVNQYSVGGGGQAGGGGGSATNPFRSQ